MLLHREMPHPPQGVGGVGEVGRGTDWRTRGLVNDHVGSLSGGGPKHKTILRTFTIGG